MGSRTDTAAAAPGDDEARAAHVPRGRVAIVHEWLTTYAGSERVLEQMIRLFPDADLFALVDFLPEAERGFLGGRTVRTSFLQRLPFARRSFRWALPLMPLAVEQFDLSAYDLVLSSSHAVAKGVLTGPGQCHVSYVHSPIRYAWDMQHQYLRRSRLGSGAPGLLIRASLSWIRVWDTRTANGVDRFVANSRFIARRIWKTYRREASVVPPPVDLDGFRPPAAGRRADSYLTACRLVPYKRVDLVIEAFRRMPERRLVVVGDGPERETIERKAASLPNVRFAGTVSRDELIRLMGEARAFVSAAEEDFGIVMAEAQACGTPLIAFGTGGARDIVGPVTADADGGGAIGPTGLLFGQQTADAIVRAVERFETQLPPFDPDACRANARRFSAEAFRARFAAEIAAALGEHAARV